MLARCVEEPMKAVFTALSEGPTPTFSATAVHPGTTEPMAAPRLGVWNRELALAMATAWDAASASRPLLSASGASPLPARSALMIEIDALAGMDGPSATNPPASATAVAVRRSRRGTERRDGQ